MARLPYMDPDDASPAVAAALAKVPPLNLFRMLANADTAYLPWMRLGGALLGELELDPRLRELAILRIARLCHSEYEWIQHESIALRIGITAEEVAAIDQADLASFAEPERALLDFTTEAVSDGQASEPALTRLNTHLSPREVIELLLVINHYTGVARITETLALDPEEPAQLDAVRDPRKPNP
jgi:4-carboxymuconolactone decarboxylase